MRRSEQEILQIVYRRSGQIRMRRHVLQVLAGAATALVLLTAGPLLVRQLAVQELDTADQPKTEQATEDETDKDAGQTTDGGRLGTDASASPGTSSAETSESSGTQKSGTLPAGNASQHSAGNLDTTFGGDGKVTTDFGTIGGEGRATAIQPDGKIVVAGYSGGTACVDGCNPTTSPSGADFALARYNADGSLDTNFGTGGKVTTDFASGYDSGEAVAIQSDGKIVVAGSSGLAGSSSLDFALARYNANGNLDPTFGAGGKVTTNFGGSDYGEAVAIQSDGKIVVAGSSGVTTCGDGCTPPPGDSGANFALARYDVNGNLDPTFGPGGTVTTDFAGNDTGNAVAIQSDGRIVVAGSSNGSDDFALARYNANGNLDSAFGGDGKVTTNVGSGSDIGRAVAIQPHGRIVVAGSSYAASCCGADFALARYLANGSLDSNFGTGGKVTTNFGGDQAHASAVAVDPGGRIVVAGEVSGGAFGKGDFALARYSANGNLDSAFGTGGKMTTNFGNTAGDAGNAVVIHDKRIVVAGFTGAPNTRHFAVVRYQG